MEQILHKLKHAEAQRKYRLRHPERVNKSIREWKRKHNYYSVASKMRRESNPLREQAHQKVYSEIRAGRLLRPAECSNCKKSCKPQAHHEDYRKPLEIRWLCRRCHYAVHGREIRVEIDQ